MNGVKFLKCLLVFHDSNSNFAAETARFDEYGWPAEPGNDESGATFGLRIAAPT